MKRALMLALIAAMLLPGGMAQARKKKKDSEAGFALGPPVPVPHSASGLDRIMGKDARTVMAYLGRPAQDVREDRARKLQFSSKDCILDAYLYPPSDGREPVVTYVTARVPDGRDAERTSCISALAKG